MILSRILILNTDSLYIIRILSSLNAIRFLYQKSFLLYFARIALTFIRYALAGWLPISTLKAMKMMTEAKFASSTICTASSYLQLFLRMKELTGNYIPFLYYFKVFNVCCIYFGMLKAVIPKFLHKAKNYVWNRVILIDLCFALLIGKKKRTQLPYDQGYTNIIPLDPMLHWLFTIFKWRYIELLRNRCFPLNYSITEYLRPKRLFCDDHDLNKNSFYYKI